MLYITAGDLLELEILGDIGGDEDVGQLSIRHEEFGNEIDVPVVGATVLLPWLFSLVVVAIFAEELFIFVSECEFQIEIVLVGMDILTVSILTEAASLWSN